MLHRRLLHVDRRPLDPVLLGSQRRQGRSSVRGDDRSRTVQDERLADALADAEPVPAGTLIRIRTTGGGGWGDPLDRDVGPGRPRCRLGQGHPGRSGRRLRRRDHRSGRCAGGRHWTRAHSVANRKCRDERQRPSRSSIAVLVIARLAGVAAAPRWTGYERAGRASAGPLDGMLVVDLSRALAGPHAGMMLGDLGARVIKVESPGRGRQPRLGAAVRAGQRRARARDATSCPATGTRSRSSVDLKSDDGRDRADRAGRAGRRADRELQAGRARPARIRRGAAARAEPGPGDLVDHRLRARRTGGQPARLRPDRPGRGRA